MKSLTASATLLFASLLATTAQAGECPAGQRMANPLTGAATAPVGVTDDELAAIDLSKENVKLAQRRLRLRHMVIQPGGIVPLHSHADRPALIMVTAGEIHEHSSQCAVPILHRAGEVAREALGTQHWWKNSGSQPVHLTIADIVNDRKPETMMEHM
ncbi:cupin domain-containing protein [Aquabacterium humicola]|uniref:cupin domain-containing protein n=1 Tax=Aquabacterium humicola TaxID=3237377 RepID=UPI0025437BEA|nr:cupin domain-containing protein [Rubrivivax pictus]